MSFLTVFPNRCIQAIALALIILSIGNQSIESQDGCCGHGGEAHGVKEVCQIVDVCNRVKVV